MTHTHRLAVVGIDGAGKTTVIRRLLDVAPREELVVVHCPTYHTSPDAPLGALSRCVEAYSQAADELKSFELKAAALYLQMTLYGPVERAMIDAFAPRYVVCERHPVVDTLAYGPFYERMVRKAVDPAKVERPLEAAMERRVPGSYRAVRAWHEAEARRLGLGVSFWDLAHDVCATLGRPLGELVTELSRRYRAGLPDVVVLLDVDGEEAQARVRARSADGATELHETATYLNALRASYGASLDALGKAHPAVRVRTVATGQGRSVDACLDDLVAEARALPAQTRATAAAAAS